MKYEVIDNFLDEEYFDSLVTLFTVPVWPPIISWGLVNQDESKRGLESYEAGENEDQWEGKDEKIFYMIHVIYDYNIPTSSHYDILLPLLEKLGTRCLMRLKVNLYPNTEKVIEHPYHTDNYFSHTGAILSLNTCDGYTKMADGTKIDSVANRILLFDASEKHAATNTTNAFARFNINMNFLSCRLNEIEHKFNWN